MKHYDSLIRMAFFVCAMIFTAKFCQKKTDTFTIASISSHRPYHPEFETRNLREIEKRELEHALNQPYHYYGLGGQAFVFFSSDGKYVLKFFKQRLFRPSWLLNHLPLPKFLQNYRSKCNWKRKDKLERDFYSYKASFEELQEQTALLYCHLNRTSHLNKRIEIVDPLKIHHFLELDHFDFIVQKRAERVFERIWKDAYEGKLSEAAETFSQILALVDTCIKKGFYNRDPYIPNNCGLIEGQAILIDVGRLEKNEAIKAEESYDAEFKRIVVPFENWLETNYPQMLPIFQEKLREALQK